jgi:protein O-GlcNAc transferase
MQYFFNFRYAELEKFQEFEQNPLINGECDIVIENPAIVIKLDAGINMYHHFCDFINLYATQHANNSFNQDIQIGMLSIYTAITKCFFIKYFTCFIKVIWDTSSSDFFSFFWDMWKVFSKNPPIYIRSFERKKVNNIIFIHRKQNCKI